MKKLEDLAEVLVGQIMTRVSSKDGEGQEVRVLVPGAVEQGYIIESSLGVNNIIKGIDNKYYTQKGDIVMKLTADYDAAIIGEDQLGIVVSSLICVIRAKKIDYRYLCAVLNSEYVKSEIRTKAAGAMRPMLKASDIRNIGIPVLSKTAQDTIGKTYELSKQKELLLMDMIDNEQEIMKAVINNSILEEIRHE